MTEERKALTLGLTAAAATAAIPVAVGVIKNLRPKPMEESDRLRAAGAAFVNAAGEAVTLHGVTLPGWPPCFTSEDAPLTAEDAWSALKARFGAYGARQLFNACGRGALTAEDLKRLRASGVNCVRVALPMDRLYREQKKRKRKAGDAIDLGLLDAVAAVCRKAEVYVIPALTGLPAALLADDKAGKAARKAVLRVWRQIAAHCSAWPEIAAYELLDQPAAGGDAQTQLQALYLQLAKAVRRADPDRILLLQAKTPAALPDPAACGGRLAVSAVSCEEAPLARQARAAQLSAFAAQVPVLVTVRHSAEPVAALESFAQAPGLIFDGWKGERGCLLSLFSGTPVDTAARDYKTLLTQCEALLATEAFASNEALQMQVRAIFGELPVQTPQTAVQIGLPKED